MPLSTLHALPLPAAYWVMTRLRSLVPKHEQLQLDQSPQMPNMQSASGVHDWSCSPASSHVLYSSRLPSKGFPQGLASSSMSRVRDCMPLPQEAEQADHALQGLHSASMHRFGHG
jgi:hypothetical protein